MFAFLGIKSSNSSQVELRDEEYDDLKDQDELTKEMENENQREDRDYVDLGQTEGIKKPELNETEETDVGDEFVSISRTTDSKAVSTNTSACAEATLSDNKCPKTEIPKEITPATPVTTADIKKENPSSSNKLDLINKRTTVSQLIELLKIDLSQESDLNDFIKTKKSGDAILGDVEVSSIASSDPIFVELQNKLLHIKSNDLAEHTKRVKLALQFVRTGMTPILIQKSIWELPTTKPISEPILLGDIIKKMGVRTDGIMDCLGELAKSKAVDLDIEVIGKIKNILKENFYNEKETLAFNTVLERANQGATRASIELYLYNEFPLSKSTFTA